MRPRHAFLGLCLASAALGILIWLIRSPFAADPVSYTVSIAKTQDAALNTALEGSSQLVTLRSKAPVGPFALVDRARRDADRFTTALKSFGYYNGSVAVRINGHPVDEAGLVALLQAAPANPPANVSVSVDPGPLFHIRQIVLTGTYPPGLQSRLSISLGAAADAGHILAARDTLLSALRDEGYALAKVTLEPATLYPRAAMMDVTYEIESGPRVAIGPITFKGLDGVHEGFARRMLKLHEGELFNASQISKARQDFAKVPIFASVTALPATELGPTGRLPITVYTSERPLRAVDLGVSYSTDLGVGLTAGWHHRNLFGNAEQLNLTAGFQGGGNSEIHPGYRVNAQLIKPGFFSPDQSLEGNLGGVKQSLLAYDQNALLQSIAINRTFSPRWSGSAGLSAEQELITQEGVSTRYNLIGVPLKLAYDSSDSLVNPTRGIRAAVLVTPQQSLTGRQATFVLTQFSGSTYLDLLGNGRTVLAMRGLIGNAFGASEFSLPPDQRFYAGGSGTVRGYRYQSVGPQFPNGQPSGGTQITAGSLELRQRFLASWGFTIFTDAGEVSAPAASLSGKYGVGAGAGLFYVTPIGPIRVQAAIPLVRLPNSGSFELYVGLGQAF